MFKLALVFIVLAFGMIIGGPYMFYQYAIWDASNPADDSSGFNLILHGFTPDVPITIINQSAEISGRVYIIDVREEKEYEESHIKNAINIPLQSLFTKIPEVIEDKHSVLYLYDQKGYSSAAGVRLLRMMGYEKAFYLENGFNGWLKMGMPATRQNPAYF